MKALRFVPAVAALALAVVVALLAADVRSWRTGLRAGDAVYSVSPPDARWKVPTRLPKGLSSRILAVGDDLQARRALQLYRAATNVRGRLDTAVETATARAEAESALAQMALTSNPQRRSQADVLLGLLAFGDYARGANQTNQAESAVADFENAVRANPDNVTAKYDLELLLRLFVARGVRVGNQAGTGTGPGRRGAAGGVEGRGY